MTPSQTRLAFALMALLVAVYVALRVVAIFSMPMVADEPDDFGIIIADAPGILNFFDAPRAYEFDQSRLPYFISAPFLYFLEERALIPLRILFLSFHLLYLVFAFKLAELITGNRLAAGAFVVLIAGSCYLASFSIFAITTSDNLFLLFHIMTIYYFLRSFRSQQDDGVFPRYVLVAVLLGLCLASKLFGVLLFAALFIFHLLNRGDGRLRVRSVHPRALIGAGLAFFAIVVVLNLVPLPARVKLGVSFVLCVGYLIVLWRALRRERSGEAIETRFLAVWGAVALTAFNVTLVFSPIYLNLHNLVRTVTWFGDWNSGLLVARSHFYDIAVITIMKYGLIAFPLLLLAGGFCVSRLRKEARAGRAHFRSSNLLLLGLVFVIQLVAISATRHKVTWYPLAIFPFLYLPIVWLWSEAIRAQHKRLAVVAAVCFAVTLADNSGRYVRWYPYGHFDGAQYGSEYVGWNRAGLVSFEALPELYAYLLTLAKEDEPVDVNCQVVNVPLYDYWVADLLREHFRRRGKEGFRFGVTPFEPGPLGESDYVLTSPVYYPRAGEQLEAWGFERIRTLSIKGIDIIAVWRPGA